MGRPPPACVTATLICLALSGYQFVGGKICQKMARLVEHLFPPGGARSQKPLFNMDDKAGKSLCFYFFLQSVYGLPIYLKESLYDSFHSLSYVTHFGQRFTSEPFYKPWDQHVYVDVFCVKVHNFSMNGHWQSGMTDQLCLDTLAGKTIGIIDFE